MSNVLIRTAKVEDAEQILNIYSYYVKNTAITFEYEVPSLEEFQNRIATTLKKYPYLVAIIDNKIVGYSYAGPFKTRRAYDWSVETTLYIHKDFHKQGIGRLLYSKLESILKQMNITNANACITYTETEDEYLTHDSPKFHKALGYNLVGRFTKCGYKFNRWYDMTWMEKMIGEHQDFQPEVIPFIELK